MGPPLNAWLLFAKSYHNVRYLLLLSYTAEAAYNHFTAAEAAGWPAYVLNESHVYLGLTMIYNEDTVGGATVDCELSISTDSVVWRRMFPGVPFIPR